MPSLPVKYVPELTILIQMSTNHAIPKSVVLESFPNTLLDLSGKLDIGAQGLHLQRRLTPSLDAKSFYNQIFFYNDTISS